MLPEWTSTFITGPFFGLAQARDGVGVFQRALAGLKVGFYIFGLSLIMRRFGLWGKDYPAVSVSLDLFTSP